MFREGTRETMVAVLLGDEVTMTRKLYLCVAAALALGCPSPPEAPPGPSAPSGQQGQAPAVANPDANGPSKGVGQAPAGSGKPPSGDTVTQPAPVGTDKPVGNPTGPPVPPNEGPHADRFVPDAGKGTESDPMASELKVLPPQRTQEQIKAGGHYLVKGTVEGECSGLVRIDVLEDKPPPAPGSAPEGPLSAADLSGVGAFSVAVPTGKKVSVAAVCDNNRDGTVGVDDPVSGPGPGDNITAAKSGVTLKLELQGPAGG